MDFLSRWTVGVVTTGQGSAIQFTSLPNLAITSIKRQVAPGRVPGSIVVSARGSRVGSPRDVRHGLSAEEIAEVRAASGGEFKDGVSRRLRLTLG
jgi:hypothetical protein